MIIKRSSTNHQKFNACNPLRHAIYFFLVSGMVLISACGGSDSSSNAENSNDEPTASLANAGLDRTVEPGTAVTLDGSASSDPSTTDLTYEWSLTTVPDGSSAVLINSRTVSPAFVPDVEGTYVAQLILNEGSTESYIDSVTLNAIVFPVAETVAANRSPGEIPEDLQVSCWSSEGTRIGQCPVLTYNDITYWTYNYKDNRSSLGIVGFDRNGSVVFNTELPGIQNIQTVTVNGQTETVTFLGSIPGADDTAMDGSVELAWAALTTNLSVADPQANAGTDQIFSPGDFVSLDGSESFGSGDMLTYTWSFESIPDNSTAVLSDTNLVSPTFVADLPGSYVIQLIVNDGLKDSVADTVLITSLDIPVVSSGMAANPPGMIPDDLKVSCSYSPGRSANPICPVLLYRGLTYWAYSYRDNRYSLALVAYDDAGNVVERWEIENTRYIWQITVDTDNATVLFYGDNFLTESVSVSWLDLIP